MSKIYNFNDINIPDLDDDFFNECEDELKNMISKYNNILENFETQFNLYKEHLVGKGDLKNVNDELGAEIFKKVIVCFNEYFDEIYKISIEESSENIVRFKDSLDYAMLSNGKRLRPFMMLLFYYLFDGEYLVFIENFMVAIEMIHTFSLIHDDLPCMDNDELRRGKPTVWKKYGEDIAVLTGDALIIEANNLILSSIRQMAESDLLPQTIIAASTFGQFVGLNGMLGGQFFDITNTNNKNLTIEEIEFMYQNKTSALLTASIMVGAIMSGKVNNEKKVSLLMEFGRSFGIAYQIQDDLLEIESTTEKIGKSVDSDKNKNKVTYVSIVGVDAAKKKVNELYSICLKNLTALTNKKNKGIALVIEDVLKHILVREK